MKFVNFFVEFSLKMLSFCLIYRNIYEMIVRMRALIEILPLKHFLWRLCRDFHNIEQATTVEAAKIWWR